MFRSTAFARHLAARAPRARVAPRTAPLGVLAVLALTVGVAACRDVTAPDQDPTTATYAATLGIRFSDYKKDTSGIYYLDVVVGSGLTVVPKSTVNYFYTGYLADGRRFDTNVGGSALTTVVGSGGVIRGVDRGFLGMNQGGRRRLIIPPALGYGNKSLSTAIPAGSVLIFEIDAAGVTAPTTTTRAPR